MTKNPFLEKVSAAGFLLCALVSAIFLFFGLWQAALGVWVGTFWMFLNCFFLLRIFELAFHAGPRFKKKIFLTCLVKFPVLYLTGFFILVSRFFPVYGLLAGLTVYLFSFTLLWLRLNRVRENFEGKAA